MYKCLIVDDVEVTRFTTKKFLSDLNVEILTAADPNEAEEILKQNTIDIIFMDWHLGKESGIDLMKKIKDQYGAQQKVIIISGVEGSERAQEALSAGANGFLEKPTTKDKLKECLHMNGLQV